MFKRKKRAPEKTLAEQLREEQKLSETECREKMRLRAENYDPARGRYEER